MRNRQRDGQYNQSGLELSIDLKSLRSLPDPGLCRLRNRFSVLLAFSRRHLRPEEFARLLDMQGKGDLWLLARPPVSAQRRRLARQLNRTLEGLLQEMEKGEFPRSGLWGASRSYGQVFGGLEE